MEPLSPRRGLGLALCGLALAVLAWAPLEAQPPDEAPLSAKALRECLETARAKHDVPALAAAWVRGDGVQALAVVGLRKKGSDTLAGGDDLFHIGSNTKPWTALLLAWLCEQGLLDWDTPLAKVFPELEKDMSDDWKKVAVTHLLTHHAGLPANLPGGWWAVPRDLGLVKQREWVVQKTVKLQLESKPGEKFAYSNLGYVLAGAVAERLGKGTWEEQLKKVVADPLGIETLGFGPVGAAGRLDQPRGHDADGKPVEPALAADNPPVMGPAGRLHLSIKDWAKFVADQVRGGRGERALLKPDTYRTMHSTPFTDTFYARGGWSGRNDPKRKPSAVLTHDGSNTFNYATVFIVPEQNVGVVVACNQGGAPGQKACHDAADQMLKRLAKLPKK